MTGVQTCALPILKTYNILSADDLQNLWIDEQHKLLAFKKGGLVFLFNFNPSESFLEFELPTGDTSDYRVIFNSDEKIFGGQSKIKTDYIYHSKTLQNKGNKSGIIIYSPSRTVIVLKKI